MKIKNIEEFKKVGNFFRDLPPEARVDMGREHSDASVANCGSPACFAGWLGEFYQTKKKEDGARYWMHGANAFARALGFSSSVDLELWALYNYGIWGNEYGDEMFSACYAFDESGKEYTHKNITVRALGEKMHGVHGRLVSGK